jgi:hypothetical protein
MSYRYRETIYHIEVLQVPGGKGRTGTRVSVNGRVQDDQRVPLVDDRQEHRVEVRTTGRVREQDKKRNAGFTPGGSIEP